MADREKLVEALRDADEYLGDYEDSMGYESIPGDVARSIHSAIRAALAAADLLDEGRETVRLREAVEALAVMPDGYCVCSYDRAGSKPDNEHQPECRDLRAALTPQPERKP